MASIPDKHIIIKTTTSKPGSTARSNSLRAQDIGNSIIYAANTVMKDSEEIWAKYKDPIARLAIEVTKGYLSSSPKKRKEARFVAARLETILENLSLTVFIGTTAAIRRERKKLFISVVNGILSLGIKIIA